MTAVEAPASTEHPVRAFWRTRRWELLGATAFVAFVAWPFLRRSHLVGGLDTYSYSSPNDAVTFEALRSLRLPQWNPFIFGGVPHLANPQVALFNPLKWPFIGFTPWRAVMLATALHLLVLTVGTVVLAHRLRLRPPSGLVAAVVVAGSGMVAVKSMQYPQITVLAGVPWLLTALDLALDRPARPRRSLGWLALATAFVFVSGHPQTTFLVLALAGGWTLSRVLRHDTWRDLWRVAAGCGLGIALAAAQLLPTLMFLDGAATRTDSFTGDPAYVLDRARVAAAVLGDVLSAQPERLSKSAEAAAIVGVAATLLALVAVVDGVRRRRERGATIVLVATATVAVVLAQGRTSFVYRAARDAIPFFDQARVPGRWMIVVTFVLAVLAAMGTDALVTRRVDRRAMYTVGAVIAAVTALLVFGVLIGPRNGHALMWVVLTSLTIAAIAIAARAPRPWSVVGVVALVLLVAIELGTMVTHGPARRVSVPATFASTTGPSVAYLDGTSTGRVMSMTQDRRGDVQYLLEGLRPNVNADRGLRSVDGYDGGPQVRSTWAQLVTALTDDHVDVTFPLGAQAVLPLDPERWARFGVRYVLLDNSVVPIEQFVPGWHQVVGTAGPLQLFENPAWSGDAFVYHATRRVARDPGRVIRTTSAGRLRDVALVGLDGPRLTCESECERRRAVVHRNTPEHLVVDASTDRRSLLALTEQWDDGWSAQIDGHDADLVKVDGFMLGVALLPGTHTVTFRYRAPGLRAGLAVSFLAAITVIALLWTGRRRSPATPRLHVTG